MKKITFIFIFSIVYACAIALFLDPNNLAPGGLTGIAIILAAVTKIPTGTWVFILNIPILIIAWRKYGFKFSALTFYSLSTIAISTNLLEILEPLTYDPISASICGAVLSGVSLGAIFRLEASTGGIDIPIRIIREKYPHIKIGIFYMLFDSIIIILSTLVFGNFETGVYAGVTVFLTSMLVDLVLYGKDEAILFFIITNHYENISTALLKELDVGVTLLDGQGAYNKSLKQIILCAVKKSTGPKVEKIVKEIDHESFLISMRASEIYGNGYKDYNEIK